MKNKLMFVLCFMINSTLVMAFPKNVENVHHVYAGMQEGDFRLSSSKKFT